MSRKPIQVPEEVKSKIENLKTAMRCKTEYEVIERLISYYEKKDNHLLVDDRVRDQFKGVKQSLFLYEDSQVVDLMLHHYGDSESLSKDSFALYVSMRR
ncbi:hypothetical protein [Brevibacillus formosus]|uniref:hypothetical protein n=1 Tax=Brevibacillus formosus TaxID=54913 RepID=UPI003F1B5F7C